jgi:hypothetical protein
MMALRRPTLAAALLLGAACPDEQEAASGGESSGDGTEATGGPTSSATTMSTPTSGSSDAGTTDGGTTGHDTTSGDGSTSAGSTSDGSSSGGRMCTDPMLQCGRDCIDPDTDLLHCGACDNPCGDNNATPSCADGLCGFECLPNFDSCDRDPETQCETDLLTDPDHCGACNAPAAPEICDAIDNDCAGVVDDGCPGGIDVSAPSYADHDQFGNLGGGAAFDDACPAGAAVHRISGNVGGNLDRLQAECAQLVLTTDGAVIPNTYTITAGATTQLPLRGGNVTTPFDLQCPADQFVVGISGEASAGGVHDLTIHCAELLVSGPPGNFVVSHGMVTTDTADGGTPGAAYSDQLAAPAVVTAVRGRGGAWIDAIGLGESDVTLLLN